MRRSLLLTLMIALPACLGSECSGSSGRHGASGDSSFTATTPAPETDPINIPATPEPSAALVFGVGLLVARAVARRRR